MKVSVITPVYNVAKYLPRCIDSLLNQTFQDFELILVDGGSVDGSAEICDEYASKNPRVKAFHQTHDNVPKARNRGMKEAKGEYLAFVDSDDYVLPQYLEHLVEETDKNPDADLVVTGSVEVFRKRRVEWRSEYHVYTLEEFKSNFTHLIGVDVVRVELYKASTIGNLRFDEEAIMGEDTIFNLHYFPRCKKIIYLPYMEYIYDRSNENSATQTFKESYIPCYRMQYIERKHFLCGDVRCTFDWTDKLFCGNQINLIQGICYQKKPIRRKKEQIREILEDELFQAVVLGDFGFPKTLLIPQKLCRRKRIGSLIIFYWIKKRLRFLKRS